MAENAPDLAEAVKILKQVEHHYRVFDRAAEAAQVVYAAHSDVSTFRKNIDKAKADLEDLQKQVAAAREAKKAADRAAVGSETARKATAGELAKLEEHLATFRPHYESEKARLARDLEGLQGKMEQELATARKERLDAIEAEVAKMTKTRETLANEIDRLTGRRNELQGQIKNALAQIGA